ncbi:hypothetical protein [Stackebrandtia soli]|uniref:hypothetical protein n=1 Tax=Stackebrandtia soli TaxID=1892856 RepID=UPI0039E86911
MASRTKKLMTLVVVGALSVTSCASTSGRLGDDTTKPVLDAISEALKDEPLLDQDQIKELCTNVANKIGKSLDDRTDGNTTQNSFDPTDGREHDCQVSRPFTDINVVLFLGVNPVSEADRGEYQDIVDDTGPLDTCEFHMDITDDTAALPSDFLPMADDAESDTFADHEYCRTVYPTTDQGLISQIVYIAHGSQIAIQLAIFKEDSNDAPMSDYADDLDELTEGVLGAVVTF